MTLENKIDFIVSLTVKNANPNGDPMDGNRPRTDYESYGEISDVCIKRKLRNRMQDMGSNIFVQANERIEDGFRSLEERFNDVFTSGKSGDKDDAVYEEACKRWADVRSFGQVITFQKRSIGVRGPVSISLAKSLEPVQVRSMQITRSTNGMASKGGKRSSDTMGSKSFVDFGVYVIKGSINPYFAEKTGFTNEDAERIKEALRTLFVNDASSARPDGTMEVNEVFWFTHPNALGVVSSAKIHGLLGVTIPEAGARDYEDYKIKLDEDQLASYKDKGLEVDVFAGQ